MKGIVFVDFHKIWDSNVKKNLDLLKSKNIAILLRNLL
jgi:hypothetical protein